MRTNARRNLLRMLLACILMTFRMVLARPYQVQAKIRTVRTKVVTEKTKDKDAIKSAKPVWKGSSRVVFRQTGLVKFRAPKAGKYTFTFSRLVNSSALEQQGAAVILMNSKLHQYKLKTEYDEKRVPYLYLGTDRFMASVRSLYDRSYLHVKGGLGTFAFMHKTTLKLKKNQLIYIVFAGLNRKASYTMRLKIK